MEHSKPLVIVLSRNYSTGLGVIRSLGAAGYPVDLIASVKKNGSSVIASSSKYVRNCVEVLTPKIQGNSGEELVRELMKYTTEANQKMILFPVDDFTTSVIDANRNALKKYFLMPEIRGGKYTSINEIMDKTLQGELAKQVGIKTPQEALVSLRDDIEIPKEVSYPCFVKPLQSVSGHKTEMAVCENESELKSHLLKMKKFFSDRSVLVQEYLNIDKEYDLSGVCTSQGVIIPAVIEKTRIAQHELGVTMTGKLVCADVLGSVKDKIAALLEEIKYVGMFDMELNLCKGEFYFNEINFRSGGPNYSYYLSGINLPELFVKELLGAKSNPEEQRVECFGKTFVYEKVAWEDYINSYMTKKEMLSCIKKADFTLLEDKNDPKPGEIFNKKIRLSAMKHKLKNRMKKKTEKKMNGTDKTEVVVTGRNYCNILTMTRALGEAGYSVEVLRVFKKKTNRLNLLNGMEPDAHSKYVTGFHKCIVNQSQEKMVEELIKLSKGKEKRLLIPVDDYTACVVDESFEQLSEYYIIPNVAKKEGELSRLMDKNEQKRLALASELPMLQSVLITSENGEFTIPDNVSYPCFLKPNVSMNSTKSMMTRCADRKSLEKVLSNYAQKGDFEMLAEEFADIRAEYSVLGVASGDAAIAPCVFKVIEGGHKERTGVTIVGEAVSSEPFKEILSKCCSYVEALEYTGIFDIDLLETKDGKLYFIEINFRAGASTHLFTKSGINLPGIFADHLLKGRKIADTDYIFDQGKRFVSEKLLLEEYARSDTNMRKIKEHMSEADVHFIKDELDPKPYKYFKKYYTVAGLMRVPYKIRDMKRKTHK